MVQIRDNALMLSRSYLPQIQNVGQFMNYYCCCTMLAHFRSDSYARIICVFTLPNLFSISCMLWKLQPLQNLNTIIWFLCVYIFYSHNISRLTSFCKHFYIYFVVTLAKFVSNALFISLNNLFISLNNLIFKIRF